MPTDALRHEPLAVEAWCDEHALHVRLLDGREVSVPLTWFPRLAQATPDQRAQHRLIGRGVGIHWPSVDEDISIKSLLL